MQNDEQKRQERRSEIRDGVKRGLLLGAAVLAVVIPVMYFDREPEPPGQAPVVTAPPAGTPQAQGPGTATGPQPDAAPEPLRLADFAGEEPSPEARHVADWAVHSGDHGRHGLVVVDKEEARVYAFGPDGRLVRSAPALLGSARGDDSAPGIGDKPLSEIEPHEKTTPAGRFVAQPGRNLEGEDIVWVDYDAAVSMHRIRPTIAAERRLERLASPTVDDNRISFGCINLPVTFYEDVLKPMVRQHGAVIYVLPETRPPQELFGSYDPRTRQVAQR